MAAGVSCENTNYITPPPSLVTPSAPITNLAASAWPKKALPELVHSPCPSPTPAATLAFFLLPELIPTSGPLHQLYPWPRMLLP